MTKTSITHALAAALALQVFAFAPLANAQTDGNEQNTEVTATPETIDPETCLRVGTLEFQDIDAFNADPAGFFAAQEARRVSLSIPARNIVVKWPQKTEDILNVAAGYGFETQQGRAIIAGLAQAALLCSQIEAASALFIQQQVAGLDNQFAINTFQTVTGNTQPAATPNQVTPQSTPSLGSPGSTFALELPQNPGGSGARNSGPGDISVPQSTNTRTVAAPSVFFDLDDDDDNGGTTTAASITTVASPIR